MAKNFIQFFKIPFNLPICHALFKTQFECGPKKLVNITVFENHWVDLVRHYEFFDR